MTYVFSDKTLIIALNEWQERRIKECPNDENKIIQHGKMILDFMESDEAVKNKMTVDY